MCSSNYCIFLILDFSSFKMWPRQHYSITGYAEGEVELPGMDPEVF